MMSESDGAVPPQDARVRPATPADERALAVIDHRTWSWAVTLVPFWPIERPFFDAGTRPEDAICRSAACSKFLGARCRPYH
jgi:hypothetical protein